MAETNQPRIISAAELAQGWDQEKHVAELKKLSIILRGTSAYFPVVMKADMDETFGGPVKHAKTRTFPDQFKVWVAPCRQTDPEARPVRPTTDAESSAVMGFGIPLRKLGIKVPDSRQFVFDVTRLEVEGGGAIYEISFQNFESMRRNLDEEVLKAQKQAKAQEEKAKREKKRAEALSKLKPPTGNESK